jgi:hypothetical protein
VTELNRVQQVLERDLALQAHLGPDSCLARKRNGQTVYFAGATMRVAQELMARGLNPERACVRLVLKTAASVLLKPTGGQSTNIT